MAELELRAVSKSFREQLVLRDISLQIPDGSFTILLGPSGCGKSTLLRIIAGLDSQTSGQVLIDGRDVDHLPPAERDIAMVFQQYALYPHLSVRENLSFALKMRRVPRETIETRIAEAAQYAPLEQLALSPQCGFSSTVHGNNIAVEDQRNKLRLVIETAREVWGDL